MILGFSTKFPKGKGRLSGKNTFFVERITSNLSRFLDEDIDNYIPKIIKSLGYNSQIELVRQVVDLKGKKHTIRKDSKDRWKKGNDIHFSINVRAKNQLQFAPVVKCKSIQKINITYNEEVCEAFGCEPCVFIDDKPLYIHDYEKLAINDGFDSVHDFFEWFNEDFEGKLIHWTNLKY